MLIEAPSRNLGEFVVRRALPTARKRMLGPFVFFDHMGPVDFKMGQGMDVRPHPHIGLSTLTYLFEGQAFHRDTLGSEQLILPGAVNWMTAGRGIAHSERSPSEARAHDQRLHGIQTWIALPREFEEVAPSFHHHPSTTIPEISDQGLRVRVIAGEWAGQRSPVAAFSELTYLDLNLPSGSRWKGQRSGHELGVYVASGEIAMGDQKLTEGQLWILPQPEVEIFATRDTRALVLGGVPLPEPRLIWWNFVSSSAERMERAKQDWREQNFGKIRGETEFIPLPEH